MSADGTMVKEVERLAQQAAEVQMVRTIEDFEQPFSAVKLFPVEPPKLPEPDSLVVHTLTGLVAFARSEGIATGYLLHIVDPMRVDIAGELMGYHRQRFTFASAQGFPRSSFAFGQFIDLERFNIALQSQFEDAGDRAAVLRVVGNVEDQNIRTQRDDGVGQTVAVKSGIGLEATPVPNPVLLAPFRTFPEVEQPVSRFVLRLKKGQAGMEAALFEGDGGAWRVEAIQKIRAWLEEQLPEAAIIA